MYEVSIVLRGGDACTRPLDVDFDEEDELDVSGVGISSIVEVIVAAWTVTLCEDPDILMESC